MAEIKLVLDLEESLKKLKLEFGNLAYLQNKYLPTAGWIYNYIGNIVIMRNTKNPRDYFPVVINNVSAPYDDDVQVLSVEYSKDETHKDTINTNLFGIATDGHYFMSKANSALLEDIQMMQNHYESLWDTSKPLTMDEIKSLSTNSIKEFNGYVIPNKHNIGLLVKIQDYDYLYIRVGYLHYNEIEETLSINPDRENFMFKNFKMGKMNKFNPIINILDNDEVKANHNFDMKLIKLGL